MNFALFQGVEKWDSRVQWLNKCVRCTSDILGRCLRHSFRIPSSPQAFLNFNEFANLCMSHGLTFTNGVAYMDASRAWTVVSICRSWFSSHRSWDVNWFSRQSAITLAFSFRWYVILRGPGTAVGTFGPSLFISDFIAGHRAWGVTSQFPMFVSPHSNGLLQVIRLMIFATQLSAILNAESQVTCHGFLNLHWCFSKLSIQGISLLKSESVIFLVDSLYTECIEAVKSRDALFSSSSELISILGEIIIIIICEVGLSP
jgi:hypothetical protein